MDYFTYLPVTPHIFKMNLPFFGGRFPVSVWLVKDDQGWIMVDAGAAGFEAALLEKTLEHTGGVKPRLLILTHGHLDHAAAAQRIREQWRTPIAAGRAEIPFLTGPQRYGSLKPGASPLYFISNFIAPALVGRNVQLPLDDGMRLGDLTVYHTPGHAPGHVALLHGPDRALLCGDVFLNFGGELSNPIPFFTYDSALNEKSQARLAELDFDHLLPSHGFYILDEGRARARMVVVKNRLAYGHAPALHPAAV